MYWDLVSFNENVRVQTQALALSEKLYNDNKKQVEIGTLAPIEIVRAEAEVAARQQDLTIAQTQVLQQETIIKNALSRNGVASPAVAEAHIIPTDRIRMPDVEPIAPIQDRMAQALSAPGPNWRRAASRSRIRNISLQGSASALLPTLDAVVNLATTAWRASPTPCRFCPDAHAAQRPSSLGGTAPFSASCLPAIFLITASGLA